MRVLKYMKDGGPLSKSWGLFIIEIKCAFSVVLLRFENGTREAYHTHAFNAVSWVLRGHLVEHILGNPVVREYTPSRTPIRTPRECFHKVYSVGTTYAISFRGPWAARWKEYLPLEDRYVTLAHGRKVVA